MGEADKLLAQFRERVKITPYPEFAVRFEPRLLANMRLAVVNVDAPYGRVMLSSAAFQVLIGSPGWHAVFEPLDNHADILNGSVGKSLGMDFWTDAYLHPDLQFMPEGLIYVAAFDGLGKMHKMLGAKVY